MPLLSSASAAHDVMTPEQVAEYLQVSVDTIYRYIRRGVLLASRVGRVYRIPRDNVELLLLSTNARSDIILRDYTTQEIEAFLQEDALDDDALSIVKHFGWIPITASGNVH